MPMRKTGKVLLWIFFGWIVIDLNYLSFFHPANKYEGYSTEAIMGVILTPFSWFLGIVALIGLLLYLRGDAQEQKAIGTWLSEDSRRMMKVTKEKYAKGFLIERFDGSISTFSCKSAGEVLRFMKKDNLKKKENEARTSKENKSISFWKIFGIIYVVFTIIIILTQIFPTRDRDSDVYYQNCDDARSQGEAPVYSNEPGYTPALDRDGDGVGCE
jgi:uncharacterized membrane protein